ncbi:MAG: siderophore-interacting protein, partial [Ilumatobacteraceae bacterium]
MADDPQYGRVERVERIAPRMVRVVLGGEGLDGYVDTPFTDQYVNALFVPEGAPYSVPFDVDEVRSTAPDHRPRGRRYTIRSWDPDARLLSIDFVIHDADGDEGDADGHHPGYAGRWAKHAAPGDLLQIVGPSGGYFPDPDADWHLMVGDESAFPAIAASLERVPVGRTAIAVLVADGPDHEIAFACPGDLRVVWVHREPDRDASEALVGAIAGLEFPAGRVHAFVHGEAGETGAVRRHLLGERGLSRGDHSISPYWRRSFTDERWREVKSDWLAE